MLKYTPDFLSKMYSRGSKIKIAWLLIILMIVGTMLFTFHSHQEYEWSDHSPIDKANTEASITADTNYCPACLFIQKADLLKATNNVAAFYSSQQLSLSVITTPLSEYKCIVKGRSPPTTV